MKEMNSKLLDEQEKTLEEFVAKNKGFFDKFAKEEYISKLKRDIKVKQSFGNKDKSFKK